MILCFGSWLSDECCSVSPISASWITSVGSLIIQVSFAGVEEGRESRGGFHRYHGDIA